MAPKSFGSNQEILFQKDLLEEEENLLWKKYKTGKLGWKAENLRCLEDTSRLKPKKQFQKLQPEDVTLQMAYETFSNTQIRFQVGFILDKHLE